jgi:uncharacterized protein YndB with AHSA1/START domain
MKPSAVNTPSDTQVEVVRSFDAPVDLVWKSFTVPELVSRWMIGPPGWSMPICEMDFRVGGKYENRFRNDEQGTEFGLVGEFREIETLSKIVQDERYRLGNAEVDMGKEAVVTLTFQETNGVTTVATLIEYASEVDRDAALATGMTTAMEMGYCRIDDLLAG